MRFLFASFFAATIATSAAAQVPCGGPFGTFVDGLKKEARQKGFKRQTVNQFFEGVEQDSATLKADRAQGIFTKPFLDFAGAVISEYRLNLGAKNTKKYDAVLATFYRELCTCIIGVTG